MNVLSLFDGVSCGRIALERAGIKVDNYYSSEIDKYAIQVADKNYPQDSDKRLGSVIELDEEYLKSLKIDIIIGGSPCQGFSVSGKLKGSATKCGKDVTNLKQYLQLKKEGFEFDGQSYLFWEFVRVWKAIQPKYFFLENVRITKKWLPMFNEAMGVEPIMINSALVSAQNRVRYYWTNIPNVTQPEDRNILMKDLISKDRNWTPNLPWSDKVWGVKKKVDMLRTIESDKSFCLTTSKTHPKNYYLNKDRTMMSKLNADEAEILQTLPLGYTNHVAETHRFKHIGNGWTVDVIAHIFKGLK